MTMNLKPDAKDIANRGVSNNGGAKPNAGYPPKSNGKKDVLNPGGSDNMRIAMGDPKATKKPAGNGAV